MIMNLSLTEENGVTIIALSGKIMGGPEATQINDQIHALIDQNKKNLIIDLEEVDWMNSSGLGILIGAITTLKNNGGKLALINVSERIRNLFRITKLKDVFPVYPDKHSAMQAFK